MSFLGQLFIKRAGAAWRSPTRLQQLVPRLTGQPAHVHPLQNLATAQQSLGRPVLPRLTAQFNSLPFTPRSTPATLTTPPSQVFRGEMTPGVSTTSRYGGATHATADLPTAAAYGRLALPTQQVSAVSTFNVPPTQRYYPDFGIERGWGGATFPQIQRSQGGAVPTSSPLLYETPAPATRASREIVRGLPLPSPASPASPGVAVHQYEAAPLPETPGWNAIMQQFVPPQYRPRPPISAAQAFNWWKSRRARDRLDRLYPPSGFANATGVLTTPPSATEPLIPSSPPTPPQPAPRVINWDID